MRRIALLAALVASLFAFAVPVAADTTPGGSGTSFSSNSEQCVTKGASTTCTDTFLNVFTNTSGTQTCLDRFTFGLIATGTFLFRSESSGCTSAGNLVVGGDGSVRLASTTVILLNCGHRRCEHPVTYTVSASDTPTGDPPTTTTTVTTTTTGSCTIITTTTDVSTPLSGTITVNGTTMSETGAIDTTTQVSSPPC